MRLGEAVALCGTVPDTSDAGTNNDAAAAALTVPTTTWLSILAWKSLGTRPRPTSVWAATSYLAMQFRHFLSRRHRTTKSSRAALHLREMHNPAQKTFTSLRPELPRVSEGIRSPRTA